MVNMAGCRDYLMSAGSGIEGWLDPGAATTTMLAAQWQIARGWDGAVGEIGIHHGRFFVYLSCLARAGERGVAMDIFEAQELNVDHSGAGNRNIFEGHLARYGLDDVAVLAGDSLAQSSGKVLDSLRGQKVRLFSVDGGHTPRHVINDVKIARDTLAPGGLVIVDDFFHLHWPGVTEGLFEYNHHCPGGRIVCIGNGKAWLSFDEHGEDFYRFLRARKFLTYSVKDVELWGKPCLAVDMRHPSDAFRSPELLPLGFWQGGRLQEVVSGKPNWCPADEEGVWSLSGTSDIELPVRKEGTGDLKILLRLLSYTGAGTNYRRMTIETAGISQTLDMPDRNSVAVEIVLPAGVVATTLTIRLDVEGGLTPASAGINEDDRPLGVQLSELRIDQLV